MGKGLILFHGEVGNNLLAGATWGKGYWYTDLQHHDDSSNVFIWASVNLKAGKSYSLSCPFWSDNDWNIYPATFSALVTDANTGAYVDWVDNRSAAARITVNKDCRLYVNIGAYGLKIYPVLVEVGDGVNLPDKDINMAVVNSAQILYA